MPDDNSSASAPNRVHLGDLTSKCGRASLSFYSLKQIGFYARFSDAGSDGYTCPAGKRALAWVVFSNQIENGSELYHARLDLLDVPDDAGCLVAGFDYFPSEKDNGWMLVNGAFLRFPKINADKPPLEVIAGGPTVFAKPAVVARVSNPVAGVAGGVRVSPVARPVNTVVGPPVFNSAAEQQAYIQAQLARSREEKAAAAAKFAGGKFKPGAGQ